MTDIDGYVYLLQKRLLDILTGLKGVVCIADDDVIIHGGNTVQHDSNLENFFKCCKDNGIQLNKDKVVLRSDTLTLMYYKGRPSASA